MKKLLLFFLVSFGTAMGSCPCGITYNKAGSLYGAYIQGNINNIKNNVTKRDVYIVIGTLVAYGCMKYSYQATLCMKDNIDNYFECVKLNKEHDEKVRYQAPLTNREKAAKYPSLRYTPRVVNKGWNFFRRD